MSELTPDGYRIVMPVQHPTRPVEKGIQCGLCGMKFDHNQAYGFACGNRDCPIQPRAY